LAPVVNAVESAAVVDSAAAGSTKDAVATTSNGLGLASDALVDGHFAAPKDAVTHNKACFEHKTLAVGELVKPFVSEDPDASLFLNPYVKTSRDGGSMTWKYEREPSTVEEALALLQKDDLSFVLRFERLDLAQWPEELKALIPEELKSELIADLAEGGTTVHLYLSAPETSALPHHADIGDVLVLQLAGEKQWFFDEGEPVTMSPGDALWVPVGTKHSAKSTGDVSAHLTIHRVTEDHKRRLNHITGDDGANDDPVSEWSDTACFPFGDAGCYGCGCNLCNICATDSGAFCTTKAEDVAVVDPCCGNGDYDECVAGEGAPQDVAYFALLSDPSKGCDYVAKSPGDRCDERGVFLGTFSNNNRPFGSDRVIDHYGEDWLLENQPRYKAKDACPVACAGGGGGGGGAKCGDCEDDGDWEYVPGDKGGKQNCKDVADIPEKRCERVGTDGRKAKKAYGSRRRARVMPRRAPRRPSAGARARARTTAASAPAAGARRPRRPRRATAQARTPRTGATRVRTARRPRRRASATRKEKTKKRARSPRARTPAASPARARRPPKAARTTTTSSSSTECPAARAARSRRSEAASGSRRTGTGATRRAGCTRTRATARTVSGRRPRTRARRAARSAERKKPPPKTSEALPPAPAKI